MQSELIKLKVKFTNRKDSELIVDTFIDACTKLDASIFEPLIDENQYFQKLDKYRFLQSLKDEFDRVKAKGIKRTLLTTGTCEGCYCGEKTHQFYGKGNKPEFSYLICYKNNKLDDIFICNYSSGEKNTIIKF